MLYNMYEISEIYNVSVRTLHRKLNSWTESLRDTGRHAKTYKKDNRTALKNPELTDFLKFCELDPEKLEKVTQRQTETQGDTQRLQVTIKEQEKFIEFLKEELKKAEDRDKRKDMLLLASVSKINVFENMINNTAKAITSEKEIITEILKDGVNICIIEDDPDQTEILKVNLKKSGFNVYDFNNVTEPTPVLNNFDLVLLDLNLSRTDPIADAEKWFDLLLSHGQNIPPIIIISGEEEERIKNAEQKINPVATFRKPLNLPELIEKIKEVVNY